MDNPSIINALKDNPWATFDFYERREGIYQMITPILHEDGDMVDIYLTESPMGEGYVRICDFGMTLMRLSYTYDLSTGARERIFEGILSNNNVQNGEGNLYIDTLLKILHESILQFAGCIQKVCNMRYWTREMIRTTFYDDLADCINTGFAAFQPKADQYPLPDYPVGVDWSLRHNSRDFYVFGVRGNDKAKNVAISLLEFQKAMLPFISLVVHEDIEDLGRRERLYITRNADTQYPFLNDFQEKAAYDIEKFAPNGRLMSST